jgi:hypothetical protein
MNAVMALIWVNDASLTPVFCFRILLDVVIGAACGLLATLLLPFRPFTGEISCN